MENQIIEIDEAGRVPLPHPLCEELHLRPGDKLSISIERGDIKLVPAKEQERLVLKGTVLVAQRVSPEPISATDVQNLIEQSREKR